MRIGIDGGCLANRRGFGRFARQLLDALASMATPHEFVVFLDRPSMTSIDISTGFELIPVDVEEAPSRAASADGRRRLTDLMLMGRAAARARLDLMYFPTSYSFFPVWKVPRVVVTIHDTLPFVHPELVFPNRRGRLAWNVKEHAAAFWAHRILTVSHASRRDLIAQLGLDPARIAVMPEGPDPVFYPRPRGPESDRILESWGIAPGTRFLLYVGGLSPHKNLPRLIEGYAQSALENVPLILVGDLGDNFHTHVPELQRQIERLGLDRRVRFTGFVPDEELAHLYSRAYALVQPSLLEGFGLPPVEAMACGTPVAYSTSGSLPEVVGDAGLSFDPRSVQSIAAALKRLFNEEALRDRLSDIAQKRSRRFNWSTAAEVLVENFEIELR